MSEFGPGQVAVSVFGDHSGQDLFKSDLAQSALNTAGISMDYGPWPFLQLGAFVGASEFDVGIPASKKGDADALAFETDPALAYGGSIKFATPRFLTKTSALIAFGSATRFSAEDNGKNLKEGMAYSAGAGVQIQFWSALNLVLGGEFYVIDGEQSSRLVTTPAPFGNSDLYRGLVGVEYFFKGKNRPFISVSFRPTGAMGWNDTYGLENASISIALGSITTLPGKASPSGLVAEEDNF